MTTFSRAWRGTWFGILATDVTIPIVLGFWEQPRNLFDVFSMLCLLGYALPVLAILAGPGAFLLSWIHAVLIESWLPRARSVEHIRRVSVFLGLPLGVANLVLIFGVGFLLHGKPLNWTGTMMPWLIAALAGGAGLGWGVTIGLAPARSARPRATRAIRRDGPPFFDNRVARTNRRAA